MHCINNTKVLQCRDDVVAFRFSNEDFDCKISIDKLALLGITNHYP
jgi:hypothetical protein